MVVFSAALKEVVLFRSTLCLSQYGAPPFAAFVWPSIFATSTVRSPWKAALLVGGASPCDLIVLAHIPERPHHIIEGFLDIDAILR